MSKSMPDYINMLSHGDLDVLEHIISHQYKKFIRFYKLISDYSDIIEEIEYQFTQPDALDISIAFSKNSNASDIKKELKNSMTVYGYTGKIKVSKETLFMSIELNE